MFRVDWKQEQFLLRCSKMVILGIEELKVGFVSSKALTGIVTSSFKKDPFQNKKE